MPLPEQILVYLIVAAAAAYLIRRGLRKGSGSCGGCEGCPSAGPPAEVRSELVQLELPPAAGQGLSEPHQRGRSGSQPGS